MAELTKVNINNTEYDIHDAKPHGELTAPLIVQGGDGNNAGKIKLDQTRSGQITNNDTSTLFGFLSNNTSDLTVGGSGYNMKLRGLGDRPQYSKGNNAAEYLAKVSDLPSEYVEATGTEDITFNFGGAHSSSTMTTATVNWVYRKWHSGLAECWGICDLWLDSNNFINIGLSKDTDNYTSGALGPVPFPTNLFTSSPMVTHSMANNGRAVFTSTAAVDTTGVSLFIVCTRGTSTRTSGGIKIHAVGQWK